MLIQLDMSDRLKWMADICKSRRKVVGNPPQELQVRIAGWKEGDLLRPEHITSLACLIELCKRSGVQQVRMGIPTELREQLEGVLHIASYWNEGKKYVKPKSEDYLNLWNVEESEVDFHAKRVEEYFSRAGFGHKDLSPLSQSLLEALYNVIDHSKCDGIAYTFVEYQKEEEKVNVAVCDFGRGIACSVKTMLPEIDDLPALEKALEPKFTIGSTAHNAGFGLSTLRSCCTNPDTLWILSNKAAIVTDGDSQRGIVLENEFEGALIFYSISLNHLEDRDIEEYVNDLNML